MSDSKPYAFFGNRAFVLEAMFEAGLSVVSTGVVADSYAHRYVKGKGLKHSAISNREEFLTWFGSLKAGRFISNGCPYIIPQAQLAGDMECINIHPSYLPDLRGTDPVPGAILHARDSGATCHVMDAGVDTGDIIAQVKLPYNSEWDAPTLYQMSFKAEIEVFKKALELDFKVQHVQKTTGNEISYTRQPEDLIVDFSESAELTCRRVRAFSNPNQRARFEWRGTIVKLVQADIIDASQYTDVAVNEVVQCDKAVLLVQKDKGLLRLVCETVPPIQVGDRLS